MPAIQPTTAQAAPTRRASGVSTRMVVSLMSLLVAVISILIIHPHSLLHFAYYFVLWNGFIYLFHREALDDFRFAFLVNSLFIGVFYLVQAHVFPDSYGTTSPLGASWTDDSYFFSLIADEIPSGIPLRTQYYVYSHPFANIINFLTLLKVDHPMDVIFFQSGTAAIIATFTKRFVVSLGGDRKLADAAYLLPLVCPFLMMHGGVIFIRDSAAAALFIYALTCWNLRRYIPALIALGVQIAIRPGTAFILAPACAIFFLAQERKLDFKRTAVVALGAAVALALAAAAIQARLPEQLIAPYMGQIGSMGVGGREAIADVTAYSDLNQIFLAILNLPFVLKFPLSGAYIFTYPFFSPKIVFASEYFDLRMVTLNVLTPIYNLWINGWIFAGAITQARAIRNQRLVVLCTILTVLLIGTYSGQTRHKTIVYPLLYVVAAIGMTKASPRERRIGYIGSLALLAVEVAVALR